MKQNRAAHKLYGSKGFKIDLMRNRRDQKIPSARQQAVQGMQRHAGRPVSQTRRTIRSDDTFAGRKSA